MNDLEEFAQILIQQLNKLDRSPSWLAKQLGIYPSTVMRWLSHETRPNDPEAVIGIANALGIREEEMRRRMLELVGYAYVEPATPADTPNKLEKSNASVLRYQHLQRWLLKHDYDQLFGVDPLCQEVTAHLDQQRHYIISIQGIGGIGKTTLTDHIVRSWIPVASNLHDVIWVSAKQQTIHPGGITGSAIRINLSSLFNDIGDMLEDDAVLRQPLPQKINRLATKFRNEPYLVVIDNLETVEDFQELTQWLSKLADPTKFILTSRENVPALAPVTYIKLTELDRNDSLALIEHTAHKHQVTGFDVEAVYKLVGGNPLALILAVSQMQEIPPSQLLTGIKLGTVEEIYRYVYWNSWQALSQEARQILLAIQRSGDKATWKSIIRRTKIEDTKVIMAMQQLIRFSLVQTPAQSTQGGFYSIHRLTSTFLRAEVLQWK